MLGKRSVCKKTKLSEGELIGYMYTVQAVDEKIDEIENQWTKTKISEKISLENLNLDEKNKVLDMLQKVQLALSHGNQDIGSAQVQPHKIEVTDQTPIWQRPRNFSQPINEEISTQCEELLSSDILEHSNSEYSSPVVPVRKTDGSLRLCIDYRKINKITRTEKFPMPNLTSYIYRPTKVKYFSKIDLVRG